MVLTTTLLLVLPPKPLPQRNTQTPNKHSGRRNAGKLYDEAILAQESYRNQANTLSLGFLVARAERAKAGPHTGWETYQLVYLDR